MATLTDWHLEDIESGKYELVFALAGKRFGEAIFLFDEKHSHTDSTDYAGLHKTNNGG